MNIRDHLLAILQEAPPPDFADILEPEAIPVPLFGDATSPSIATVSINPSGSEFRGKKRHLPKRGDLQGNGGGGLSKDAAENALEELHNYFDDSKRIERVEGGYFSARRKAHWQFFYAFDDILRFADAGYSKGVHRAVHLDILPWATKRGWSKLKEKSRRTLIGPKERELFRTTLKLLPQVRIILGNGRFVHEQLQELFPASRSLKNETNTDDPHSPWNLARWDAELDGRPISIVSWSQFIPNQYMPEWVKNEIKKSLVNALR